MGLDWGAAQVDLCGSMSWPYPLSWIQNVFHGDAMTISFRLDQELKEKLDSLARARGVSRSDLIRECLKDFLSREEQRPSAWELGKELFGRIGSGHRTLARDRKQIVKERIRGSEA